MEHENRQEAWTIASNTAKSVLLSLGTACAGAVIMYAAHGQAAASPNALAGFWLGVLLFGLGVAGLIAAEDIETLVEPARRILSIKKKSYWGETLLVVNFEEVGAVRSVKIGSSSDGTPSYFLVVDLKNGSSLATGRWSADQEEISGLAGRLAAQLGCRASGEGPAPSPALLRHLAVSAVFAVAVYAAWYRLKVGPWCPAMWHGTAPPLIMLAAFSALLGLLKRFWR